jgi:Mu-like prophage major head subunit gpT
MPEMLELIESLRESEASVERLFGSEGQRVRSVAHDPSRLIEAAKFLDEIYSGKRPLYHLSEAMSTSDFPELFADILDRQTLGYFKETTPTWQAYAERTTVPDFRNVRRSAVDGAEGPLAEVDELEEYPETKLQYHKDEFHVRKYGRRIDLSWEAWVNDDLDSFRRMPERLARGARRSEARLATALFVDEKGPHASLYKAEWENIVLVEGKQPKLSLESLQAALTQLSKAKDFDGEPIEIDMVTLVVPPALSVLAENIMNALSIRMTTEGGSEKQQLEAVNWMKNRFRVVVEPYIPIIASKENGDSSWFLFTTPGTSRPALQMGFLRGYETPGLYERVPNQRRVGGGGGEVIESFEDDSRAWKIRHVMGGARLTTTGGYKSTAASNGSGK